MEHPPEDHAQRALYNDVKKVGNYFLTKTLGEGAFSKVKLGIHETTEQHVAIKIMKKSGLMQQGLVNQVKKEIAIMKLIQHPNVVQLYDVLSSPTNMYLVMELITGGEIFWKVVAEKKFTEDVARRYFHQLIDGIEYCHNHGVYHRDLKPENLLLDEEGNLKISDFGLSTQMRGDAPIDGPLSPTQKRNAEKILLKTRCGTPQYAAPEILGRNGYHGGEVDVWACGVILYVFLCGVLPFDSPNEAELFQKIVRADVLYPFSLSKEAKDLLRKIFVVNPDDRITIPEIKIHPWFTKDYEEKYTAPVDISDLTLCDFEDSESCDDAIAAVSRGDAPPAGSRLSGRRLSSMNAFELINLAGTLNFTKLLRDVKKPQMTKEPSYFTTKGRVDTIIRELKASLKALTYTGYSFDAATLQFHVTGRSKMKGFLLFDIIVSRVTDQIRIVDFERRTGSILEFWRIFQIIRSKCCSSLEIESPQSRDHVLHFLMPKAYVPPLSADSDFLKKAGDALIDRTEIDRKTMDHLYAVSHELYSHRDGEFSRNCLYNLGDISSMMDIGLAKSIQTKMCSSCNSLMIPGITCKTRVKKAIRKPKNKKKPRRVSIFCLRCNYSNIFPGSDPTIVSDLEKEAKEEQSIAPQHQKSKKTVENSKTKPQKKQTSKAKKRSKHKNSLKAMLKQSKEKEEKSHSLSDFLQLV